MVRETHFSTKKYVVKADSFEDGMFFGPIFLYFLKICKGNSSLADYRMHTVHESTLNVIFPHGIKTDLFFMY